MTLQIFLHFFSSQVCNIPPIHVAAPSHLCPQPTAHRRCATPPEAESDRALRTSSPIAVVAEPDRALRTSSPIAVVTESDRSADLIAYCSSGGTRPRERSRFQLTLDSVGGTCTADAPPLTHSCYTSTAAPPCGAYLPLHSIPGRTVRGNLGFEQG